MIKWPWESVQDTEAIDELTSALKENSETIDHLRKDLSSIAVIVQANVESTQDVQKSIEILHQKTKSVEGGLEKTAEAINHMWYFINGDTAGKENVKREYLKRTFSWCRDFVSHHHLLIVSWIMLAATLAGAFYIFL